MADNTFTLSQATDLARYFLGPGWEAGTDASTGAPVLFTFGKPSISAPTWRSVFRDAGVKLPYKGRVVNVGATVMDGESPIASARSTTQANRIARALNFYAEHHPDTT